MVPIDKNVNEHFVHALLSISDFFVNELRSEMSQANSCLLKSVVENRNEGDVRVKATLL